MNDGVMVVMDDGLSADPQSVRVLGFGQQEPVPCMTYVIVENPNNGRRWFGIIGEPNLNLNQAGLGPGSPQAMNALRAIGIGQYQQSLLVNQVYLYLVKLCATIEPDESIRGVSQRPDIAATVRPATGEEVNRYLDLPDHDSAFEVGRMVVNGAPVEVGPRQLVHHVVVAGSTGSGKTNLVATIVDNAQRAGYFVVIFDRKPDFTETHLPNDEMEDGGRALDGVARFCLAREDSRLLEGECRVSVAPSELDIELLAATLFPQSDELIQRDAFEEYARLESDEKPHWTFDSLSQTIDHAIENNQFHDYDRRTVTTVKRKFRKRRGDRLFWADSRPDRDFGHDLPGLAMRRGVARLSIAEEMRPGRVLILRSDGLMPGSYALFLDHICRQVDRCKTDGRADQTPALIVIDEAQDIFQASMKSERDSGIRCLTGHIRKGRSKRICFLLAVQSALSVPDDIMINLNTRIALRHMSAKALDSVLSVDEGTAGLVTGFGPGEALARLYGARTIVHGLMHRSPFNLTKE